MLEDVDEQEEERIALRSIYEGDNAFKEVNEVTFQYKYGDDNDLQSFLVEIQWDKNYPTQKPSINMDTFYNRNLPNDVKIKIKTILLSKAEEWLGCAMTYTLFECLKECLHELTEEIITITPSNETTASISINESTNNHERKKEVKKEHISKSQKRKQWDCVDSKGNRPRGWNWIDVIKHLSQTGN